MARALVLSGGSIKGAFQAGAIRSVAEAGFLPEVMLGISTGALSASFLANELGQLCPNRPPDPGTWGRAAERFIDFCRIRITRPDVVARRRSWLAIGWALLWGKFNGFSDTAPLERLLKEHFGTGAHLRSSPVPILVGAVNMTSGSIEYASQDDPDIVRCIYASTAIPLSMPLVAMKGSYYYDGGLRDIAPVGRAINLGADEIVIVSCETRALKAATFNPGNVIRLVSRVVDIAMNELVLNDLSEVRRKNVLLTRMPGAAPLARYKTIHWRLIDPLEEIPVSLSDFTAADVAEMIDLGRRRGRAVMEQPWEH